MTQAPQPLADTQATRPEAFQVLDAQALAPTTVEVTYDGKVYPIDLQFTKEDDTLRQLLAANGLTGAANALVERQADGSIQLVKRGGPNGTGALTLEPALDAALEADVVLDQQTHVVQDLVRRLSQLPEHIKPAIQCDWELRQLEWSGRLRLTDVLRWQGMIDKAITDGRAEHMLVKEIETWLGECLSVPDQTAPGLM